MNIISAPHCWNRSEAAIASIEGHLISSKAILLTKSDMTSTSTSIMVLLNQFYIHSVTKRSPVGISLRETSLDILDTEILMF